jgi:phospholipase/carboxylesterase
VDDILEAIYVGPLAGGKPDCLIVLCHGLHADGSQLSQLAEVWRGALPSAGFALPHAPWARRRLGFFRRKRREWFSIRDKSPDAYEAGVRAAAALLDRFIDAELDRLALGPEDYVLAGYSQGAMTVLFAGLRRAVPPRAIVAIAGSLIAPGRLAAEIRNRPPILLMHGMEDQLVPVQSSRSAARELSGAGVLVETLYPAGLAHDLDEVEIRESALFLRRIFKPRQIRGIFSKGNLSPDSDVKSYIV